MRLTHKIINEYERKERVKERHQQKATEEANEFNRKIEEDKKQRKQIKEETVVSKLDTQIQLYELKRNTLKLEQQSLTIKINELKRQQGKEEREQERHEQSLLAPWEKVRNKLCKGHSQQVHVPMTQEQKIERLDKIVDELQSEMMHVMNYIK